MCISDTPLPAHPTTNEPNQSTRQRVLAQSKYLGQLKGITQTLGYSDQGAHDELHFFTFQKFVDESVGSLLIRIRFIS